MKIERVIIAAVFASIVILTPLIPWIVENALMITSEPLHMILIRGLTGTIMYILGIYVLSAIRPAKQKVAIGKRKINMFGILLGIIIIGVAWFTDLSSYIVSVACPKDMTYQLFIWSIDIHFIMIRFVVAIMTFVGVLLIKKSVKRELPKVTEEDYIPIGELDV